MLLLKWYVNVVLSRQKKAHSFYGANHLPSRLRFTMIRAELLDTLELTGFYNTILTNVQTRSSSLKITHMYCAGRRSYFMVMDDESVFCERGLQTVVDELRISTGRTIEHDGNTQATTADPADAGVAAEKGKRSEGQAAGVTSGQPSSSTHSQQQQRPPRWRESRASWAGLRTSVGANGLVRFALR
eukprot:COSAG05_NODE_722_length_7764_cov_6.682322_6_plen_186_part_00